MLACVYLLPACLCIPNVPLCWHLELYHTSLCPSLRCLVLFIYTPVCWATLDTASRPVSDVHVYVWACLLPPFLRLCHPLFLYFSVSSLSSSLCVIEKFWHWFQNCSSFQCFGSCVKSLETLFGSATLLRSGWPWSFKKISDRYWHFLCFEAHTPFETSCHSHNIQYVLCQMYQTPHVFETRQPTAHIWSTFELFRLIFCFLYQHSVWQKDQQNY